MPRERQFPKLPRTPLSDWSDYLDLQEHELDDMTLKELVALADKLKVQLDALNAIIEERTEGSE